MRDRDGSSQHRDRLSPPERVIRAVPELGRSRTRRSASGRGRQALACAAGLRVRRTRPLAACDREGLGGFPYRVDLSARIHLRSLHRRGSGPFGSSVGRIHPRGLGDGTSVAGRSPRAQPGNGPVARLREGSRRTTRHRPVGVGGLGDLRGRALHDRLPFRRSAGRPVPQRRPRPRLRGNVGHGGLRHPVDRHRGGVPRVQGRRSERPDRQRDECGAVRPLPGPADRPSRRRTGCRPRVRGLKRSCLGSADPVHLAKPPAAPSGRRSPEATSATRSMDLHIRVLGGEQLGVHHRVR